FGLPAPSISSVRTGRLLSTSCCELNSMPSFNLYSAATSPASRKYLMASLIGPLTWPGALISVSQPSATAFSQDSLNTLSSRLLSSPVAKSQPYSTPSTPTGMLDFLIRSSTWAFVMPASKQRLKSVRRNSTASKPPCFAASSAVASGVVSIVHIWSARRPNFSFKLLALVLQDIEARIGVGQEHQSVLVDEDVTRLNHLGGVGPLVDD